ncbi:MAG: hypothetical protein WKF73_04040 [Nocardioidaceae bacterium]
MAHEARLLACLSAEEQQQLATLLRTLLIGLGDVPQPTRANPDARVRSRRVPRPER